MKADSATRPTRTLVLAGLLATLLILLSPFGAASAGAAESQGERQLTPQPKTSLAEIEDEVMCTICGTLLGLSEAPAADRQRAMIQRLIDQGMGKEEIKRELVDEFGPSVLALPEGSGFNLTAYLVPIIGMLIAAVALLMALRRWRRDTAQTEAIADRSNTDGTDDGLPPAESQRLDADLARYDL